MKCSKVAGRIAPAKPYSLVIVLYGRHGSWRCQLLGACFSCVSVYCNGSPRLQFLPHSLAARPLEFVGPPAGSRLAESACPANCYGACNVNTLCCNTGAPANCQQCKQNDGKKCATCNTPLYPTSTGQVGGPGQVCQQGSDLSRPRLEVFKA